MESFIYPELNKVCRTKDKSQIKYFGSYAAALSYIIYFANSQLNEKKLTGCTDLYRGLQLYEEEIVDFNLNKTVNLTGYTSSTLQI